MLDWWRLTYRHDFILARPFEDEGRSTPSTAVSEDGVLAPGPVFARVTVRQTVRKRDRQHARRRPGSPSSCHARVAAELELHPLDRKKFHARTGNELDNDYNGCCNTPTATQIGRLFHLSFHGARWSCSRRSPHARRDRQSDGDLRMNGRDERPTTGEASPGREIASRDRLIAVSGQADFDSFGQAAHPGDARAQVVAVVGRIRERLDRVGAAGACFDDVLKLNTYYCHRVGAGALRDGADPRSHCFSPPGPALSDVPVDELAYPGMLAESRRSRRSARGEGSSHGEQGVTSPLQRAVPQLGWNMLPRASRIDARKPRGGSGMFPQVRGGRCRSSAARAKCRLHNGFHRLTV